MIPRKASILRRLFATLSVLSLLLCLATGALWWRSYRVADSWWAPSSGVGTSAGSLLIARGMFPPTVHEDRWYHESAHPADPASFKFGLYQEPNPWHPGMTIWTIIVPLWLPLLLFAIAPAVWLLWLRARRRRRRLGLCHQCGYDLRASAGRCPECGAGKREIHLRS